MKYLSKTTLSLALVGAVLLFIQIGCSTSPTTTTQTTPSPSPSAETAAALVTSPTPAAPDTAVSPGTAGSAASTAPSGGPPPAAGTATKPAAPVEAPTPKPPRVYTIPAGTAISVFTEKDLSTKTANNGERFSGSLSRAIVDGDWVVVKKGARVEGVVVNSDPGGRVKGRASISVKLQSLTLADGRTVAIATNSYVKEAKSTKKKDATKIGIGAGVGAAIGAIAGGGKGAGIGALAGGGAGTGVVMATRGDPAVIPSESQLTFRLSAPIKVTKQ